MLYYVDLEKDYGKLYLLQPSQNIVWQGSN